MNYYHTNEEIDEIGEGLIGMQTDIFDDSLIRMKTGGYEEPDFEMTM